MKNTRWIVEVTNDKGEWDACFGGPETLAATKEQTYTDVAKFIEHNQLLPDNPTLDLSNGNHLVGALLGCIGHNIMHGERDSEGAILSNRMCGAQIGIITDYKYWHAVVDKKNLMTEINPIDKKQCKKLVASCLKRAVDQMAFKKLH